MCMYVCTCVCVCVYIYVSVRVYVRLSACVVRCSVTEERVKNRRGEYGWCDAALRFW